MGAQPDGPPCRLADGNIGIGGLPARLLFRCAQLLAPDGRLLIEAEPGMSTSR